MKFSLSGLSDTWAKYGTLILFAIAAVLIAFWTYSATHQPNVQQQQQQKRNDYINTVSALQTNLEYERRYDRAKELLTTKRLAKLYRDGIPDKYDTNVKHAAEIGYKDILVAQKFETPSVPDTTGGIRSVFDNLGYRNLKRVLF